MFRTKDVLPLTLKKMGLKRQIAIHSVIMHWKDIVGSDVALQSQPTTVKNNILFVAVKTPVWGHHLSMMKEQILAKVHAYLEEKLLDDIKFYAGNFQNFTNLVEEEENFAERIRKTTLSSAQCMEVKTIAHAVTDGVLRNRLQRVMLKDKRRKELLHKDGWRPCKLCAALCSPDEEFCTTCSLENSRRRREDIRRLLADAPWIDYQEANLYLACSETDYMRSRQELIQSLLYRINADKPIELEISTLAMLLFRLKPEKLDQESMERTLRYVRRNRYVFTSGR